MSSVSIGDHALLSDCHSAALVTRDGSVDWLCFPRFDSPSIFARLLDEGAGHWSIRPTGEYEVTRRYLDRTLVLETTFHTTTGIVVLTDALAMGPGNTGHRLGAGAPHLLVRSAMCADGTVDLEMRYEPRPEYGIVVPLVSAIDGGITTRGGAEWLVLSTPIAADVARSSASARFTLHAGDTVSFALHRSTLEETPARVWSQGEVAARLGDTINAWESWSALHQNYLGPWRELVHHSGRVLQGLTFQPSGAIVAAATTSLPEGIGGERNWDYRYSWVRDASFTMEALWVAACPDEADDFFAFMTTAAAGSVEPDQTLQIMFGVGGERDLTERELPHLAGWRGSRPVRVGNGAWDQRQIDVYGELLGATHRLAEQLTGMDRDMRGFLVALADIAAARWRDADQGIWEIRGAPQDFLYAKVMCWVALDRAIALSDRLQATAKVSAWKVARDEIRQAVIGTGWNPAAGAFTQYFGSAELDASALMMPIVGFLPADDPRMLATIDAIAERLTDDRAGLPLSHQARRRRPRRRRRHVPALHVLARAGSRDVRSGWACPGRLRAGRRFRERRRPARRGGRSDERRTARQLPAGVQSHRPGERRLGDRRGRGKGGPPMKAVAVHPRVPGSAHLLDVPEPAVSDVDGGRGVLVRVLRVGLDGTDQEIDAGEYGKTPAGADYLVLGHESLGVVEEVGPAVSELAPGDHVVAGFAAPAPACTTPLTVPT